MQDSRNIEVSIGQDEKVDDITELQKDASSQVTVKDTNCGTSTSA